MAYTRKPIRFDALDRFGHRYTRTPDQLSAMIDSGRYTVDKLTSGAIGIRAFWEPEHDRTVFSPVYRGM